MENVKYSGDMLKILFKKLNMSTTAEFCMKTKISRGLVDKLVANKHNPRLDTLQKIKNAFPQTNMNWLISRHGEVLENVKDDNEMELIELYRAKLKSIGNPRMIEKFFVSVEYFVHDHWEMDELENNATAQDVKDKEFLHFRKDLLFLQYRRRLVLDLLSQASKKKTLITGHIPGLKEKYSDLLDHLNNEILKTVKLVTDDVVNNPEETEQDVASEIYFDEDLKVKE